MKKNLFKKATALMLASALAVSTALPAWAFDNVTGKEPAGDVTGMEPTDNATGMEPAGDRPAEVTMAIDAAETETLNEELDKDPEITTALTESSGEEPTVGGSGPSFTADEFAEMMDDTVYMNDTMGLVCLAGGGTICRRGGSWRSGIEAVPYDPADFTYDAATGIYRSDDGWKYEINDGKVVRIVDEANPDKVYSACRNVSLSELYPSLVNYCTVDGLLFAGKDMIDAYCGDDFDYKWIFEDADGNLRLLNMCFETGPDNNPFVLFHTFVEMPGWPETIDEINTIVYLYDDTYNEEYTLAYYPVSTGDVDDGTVTVEAEDGVPDADNEDVYWVHDGRTVTLTVTPDDDYRLKKLFYNGIKIEPAGGVYSFVMPEGSVDITAEFEEKAPFTAEEFKTMMNGYVYSDAVEGEEAEEIICMDDDGLIRYSGQSDYEQIEYAPEQPVWAYDSVTENVIYNNSWYFRNDNGKIRQIVIGDRIYRAYPELDTSDLLTKMADSYEGEYEGTKYTLRKTESGFNLTAGSSRTAYDFNEYKAFRTGSQGDILMFKSDGELFRPIVFSQEGDSDVSDIYIPADNSQGEKICLHAVDPDTLPKPAFKSTSLVLSGQIGVNFYMKLPELDGVDYSTSYVEFTVAGKGGRTTKAAFNPNFMNRKKTYYGFTCYVNAVQMADTITAVFHYTQDGEEKTCTDTYTVEQYLVQARGAFGDKLDALMQAMFDYGYYSQQFLSRSQKWTLGVDHAAMELMSPTEYSSDDIAAVQAAVENMGCEISLKKQDIQKATCSLLLESETTIELYFKPAEGYTGSFSAKLNGKTVKAKKQSDGRYKVTIPNISANNLGTVYNVTVTTDSGTSTASLSAMFYVKGTLDLGLENTYRVNMVASLYNYQRTAKAYMG